jgi:hypothetical protein
MRLTIRAGPRKEWDKGIKMPLNTGSVCSAPISRTLAIP